LAEEDCAVPCAFVVCALAMPKDSSAAATAADSTETERDGMFDMDFSKVRKKDRPADVW
jgi:hypothetical protein